MEFSEREGLHPPINSERMGFGFTAEVKIYDKNGFISWCKSFGINTNEIELDYYSNEGILIPLPVANNSESYYSSDQIFAIEAIQKNKFITVHEFDIKTDQQTWKKRQDKYKQILDARKDSLLVEIERRYKGVEIYYEILKIKELFLAEKRNFSSNFQRKWGDSPEPADKNGFSQVWKKDNFPKYRKEFSEKYQMENEQLLSIAKHFATIGFSVDPMFAGWEKIHSLPRQDVCHINGTYKFSRACYTISETILWFIKVEKGKNFTLKDWFREYNLYYLIKPTQQTCKICDFQFEPKTGGKPQVNCSKECEKKYRRQMEVERRKISKT